MYLRCSMQYYFRYVRGLKMPPELAPQAGTAGHAAVEADGRRKIRTGSNMPLDEMLDYFGPTYDQMTAEVELKPDDDKGRVKDEIVASLTTYATTVAQKIMPVMVERSFSLDLQDPTIRPVQGRIDLIDVKAKGTYGIWDNKFTMSRRPKSQLEIDTSPQLSTYDLAFEQDTGQAPTDLGIIQFMPPGRDVIRYPAQVQVIRRDPKLMTPEARALRKARTIHQYRTAEAGIAAGIHIPTDNAMVCGWCGYRAICQSAAVSEWDATKIRKETDDPAS